MPTRARQYGLTPARVYPALTLVVLLAVVGLWGASGFGRSTGNGSELPNGARDPMHPDRHLRVLMTNSSSSYYILRGEQYGFEYELARRIARELDLHLQVVLPDPAVPPLEMLRSGRVDVVAMPFFDDDDLGEGIALTAPYHAVQQRLVLHRDEARLVHGLRDLDGLRVATRRASAGERELARLRRLGVDLVAVLHDPQVPQEQILDLVADGTYPAAVALDSEIEAARRFRSELRESFELGPRRVVHWAVRTDVAGLRERLDAALTGHVQRSESGRIIGSEFYNVVRARYFEDAPRAERHQGDPYLYDRTGQLSEFDSLFRAAARKFDFDWRLLAAIAFQESRFDPAAVSWAGAHGLMQLRPRTAGVTAAELGNPQLNVMLGAEHLRKLHDLYADVPEPDRTRFALAAYNCGQGHLDDARKLSSLLGKDPDVWEGSVRESLLLLRQPRYHRLVRYGFVRGNETVAYVREIEQHFEELKQMGRNARRVQVVAGGGGSESDLADEGTTALAAPSMD